MIATAAQKEEAEIVDDVDLEEEGISDDDDGHIVNAQRPKDSKIAAEGTFTIENPLYAELRTCREKANDTFGMIHCYEKAALYHPVNYSLFSTLSLLYLRGELINNAREAMNRSVTLWLDNVKFMFDKSDENKEKTYVDVLRRVYDYGRDKNISEWKESAVEMGHLLAKKFELEHKVGDAHQVYYGFLLQLGTGFDNCMDFHRRTGNIISMVTMGNPNETSIAFRVAEAVGPIVEGLTEHLMSYGKMDLTIRRMCGIQFDQNDEIKGAEIIAHAMDCLRRWGNYTQLLTEEQPDDRNLQVYTKMQYTPLHRMAWLGATYTLKETIQHFQGRTIPSDRFGRGLLHYATAAARESTVRMLVDQGSRWDKEDKARIQPAHLACSAWGFKQAFEEIAGSGVCLGISRNRVEDNDVEPTDETGTDGGWNKHAKQRTWEKYQQCDFDVRDASKVFQQDICIGYMQANVPLVLRGAFFDHDDGPPRKWRIAPFNRTFGNVELRQETTPQGERWGIGHAKVTTISAFLNTLSDDDGTVGNFLVESQRHPLYELAGWVPASFLRTKQDNEVIFFDVDSSVPLVSVMKAGSKSHHHVRSFASFYAVIYGHVEFSALPPRVARTIRSNVLDPSMAPHTGRCTLLAGDVLLLPEQWSLSWISKANGVMIQRFFLPKM